MSGGRLQLASSGIQDYFLTTNPDVTFFKQVYKKHTKFALETLDNPFDDQVEFGTTIRCVIPRKGDLVRNIYFRVELPPLMTGAETGDVGYTDSVGNAIIEFADLIIGGQIIQRLTGEFIELHNQLYYTDSKQKSFERLVGTTGTRTGLGVANSSNYPRTFVVPLCFYNTESEPLCIPLSALSKQEVEVQIKLRTLSEIAVTSGTILDYNPSAQILNATLPVEYVYLENEEIDFIRNTRLEYLITQTQLAKGSIDAGSTNIKYRINFINPVKELYFVIQDDFISESNIYTGNDYFNYNNIGYTATYPQYHQLSDLKLEFNDEIAIDNRIADANFLSSLQPMLHHSRVPKDDRRFYVYSFSIDPESYYPTGQINMSRIQNKILSVTLTPASKKRSLRIYAQSYNILRIENGLAGILFIDNNTI